MKNLLLGMVLLFTINVTAQHKSNWTYVKDIKPDKWTIQSPIQHTVTIPNANKTTNTVVGGTVGYLVTGGLLGTIAGAVVGNVASDDVKTYTQTEYIPVEVNGYLITTADGRVFRSASKYKIYQLLDMTKVNTTQ